MSHGECDDWWDTFEAPHWFVEFLEHLGLIKRDEWNIEQTKFVNEQMKILRSLQEKWSNH